MTPAPDRSELLVLSAADVRAVLTHHGCAEAMRAALTAVASGQAAQPLRNVVRMAGASGLLALMPSFLAGGLEAGAGRYGLKAICITPGNPAIGLDTHQGVVLLSDGRTGQPAALLNASAITEIRTAAVSVIATEQLARQDASELAVIGTGVQARAHILALDAARRLQEIRVAGRDAAKAGQFAASLAGQTTAPVRPAGTAREAISGADIVVTATSSAEPVLAREWLAPGVHINAVGACLPGQRELDAETVGAGVLFADSRESLLSESGDYRLAVADGMRPQVRATLGEVLTGTAPGRATAAEITIFESLGLAVQDLAAAEYAVAAAERRRHGPDAAGTWVRF